MFIATLIHFCCTCSSLEPMYLLESYRLNCLEETTRNLLLSTRNRQKMHGRIRSYNCWSVRPQNNLWQLWNFMTVTLIFCYYDGTLIVIMMVSAIGIFFFIFWKAVQYSMQLHFDMLIVGRPMFLVDSLLCNFVHLTAIVSYWPDQLCFKRK